MPDDMCQTEMMILADALLACGLDPRSVIAHRIALHPDDADDAYRTTADLARTNHALIYERMQDSAIFGQEALVASFLAGTDDLTPFAGLRRLVARRPGLAPGDIVYDPEIAHLLHNYIARVSQPVFYDAFEDPRGAGLAGCVLRWPEGSDCRHGHDPVLFAHRLPGEATTA